MPLMMQFTLLSTVFLLPIALAGSVALAIALVPYHYKGKEKRH